MVVGGEMKGNEDTEKQSSCAINAAAAVVVFFFVKE